MKKNYLKPTTENVTLKSAWSLCETSWQESGQTGNPGGTHHPPTGNGMPRKGSPIFG